MSNFFLSFFNALGFANKVFPSFGILVASIFFTAASATPIETPTISTEANEKENSPDHSSSPSIPSHQETIEQKKEQKIVYFLSNFWGDIFDPKPDQVVYYDLEPTVRLHQTASKAGYDLRLADSSSYSLRNISGRGEEFPSDFDYIICFDIAPFRHDYLSKYPKEKVILVLWEPPTTMPYNYDPHYHSPFSRVYTWKDDLVDGKTYFKIHYPVLRPMEKDLVDFDKKKFSVMVGANKHSWHPNEIYSERRKIAEFFELNHPSDFDLFGGEWTEKPQTYKGGLPGGMDAKVKKIKEYKFVFALENGKEIPGYVTEKIFNCFQAGSIPVYLGAPNITSYVPKNCFIAIEDFKSHEELYQFLKNMSKETYMDYLNHIQKFLESEQVQNFSSDHFVKTMMGLIETPPKN